jgi:hypothetical protein
MFGRNQWEASRRHRGVAPLLISRAPLHRLSRAEGRGGTRPRRHSMPRSAERFILMCGRAGTSVPSAAVSPATQAPSPLPHPVSTRSLVITTGAGAPRRDARVFPKSGRVSLHDYARDLGCCLKPSVSTGLRGDLGCFWRLFLRTRPVISMDTSSNLRSTRHGQGPVGGSL